MAALEEVLKTSFIIFCLLEISLSIENGKLHKQKYASVLIFFYIFFYFLYKIVGKSYPRTYFFGT
jgi:hypothetical protein